MRASKLTAYAAALVAGLPMHLPEARSAEVAGATASLDGKALFTRRCGICHLADGGGTWMLERRLGKAQSMLELRTDLQAAYIRRITRYGLNGMPRFTRVELPDADLDAVTAYLTRPGSRP